MPNTDALWFTPTHFDFATAHQQAWLCDRGSLTEKLRQRFQQIEVNIDQQGMATPLPWETQALNITPNQTTWVRAVHLTDAHQPLIYARSIIPDFQPHNPWFALQNLGTQPLGERLFSLPELTRSAFEFSYLTLADSPTPYPARRCIFYHQTYPLLLTEVFLFLPHAA